MPQCSTSLAVSVSHPIILSCLHKSVRIHIVLEMNVLRHHISSSRKGTSAHHTYQGSKWKCCLSVPHSWNGRQGCQGAPPPPISSASPLKFAKLRHAASALQEIHDSGRKLKVGSLHEHYEIIARVQTCFFVGKVEHHFGTDQSARLQKDLQSWQNLPWLALLVCLILQHAAANGRRPTATCQCDAECAGKLSCNMTQESEPN